MPFKFGRPTKMGWGVVLRVASVLTAVLVVGGVVYGYGKLAGTVEKLREDIAEIKNRHLHQLQVQTEDTARTVAALRQKVNDEIIPWLNEIKKEGPPISRAQLKALYQEQQLLRAELAKLSAMAELDRTVKAAMGPIRDEWEEANALQLLRLPRPAGLTFIPDEVTVTTPPHVNVSAEADVVRLEGTVPSEKAKQAIVKAAEGSLSKSAQFQRLDASNLKIRP